VHEALDKMSVELTAVAFEKVRADEQQALLEAVSLVRTYREQIESRFRSAFLDIFERRLFSRPSAAPAAAPAGELSLVEESFVIVLLEVFLLVGSTSRKLDHDKVLGRMTRLSVFIDLDWFEEVRPPSLPDAIF